ncbi:methyltransferase domain-containing protein [Streptomyces sp. NPDC021020]|uniref:methyltransferase domain-containing protein n=1 Tax=Streptomyces sp. NPDC021020 TaxID=3365109 RepID=UPI00378BAB70
MRSLADSGVLAAPWTAVFEDVDRARFLPPVMWPYDMTTRTSTAVSRADDPDAWFGFADADVPLTTQWDDGRHQGPAPGRVPTSSASAPTVVAAMLHALDVHDGMRVLEIGTGTGWNAALLARRLGEEYVTSIEIDPAVAAAAATALHDAGTAPTLIVGDGLLGYPQRTPYDRVVSTMAVRSVPYAWVRQTAPRGMLVTPWGTHYSNADALARLVVADDHSRAEGHFIRPVEFMKARSHRRGRAPHTEYVPGGDVVAAADRTTTTDLTAADLTAPDFAFAAGLITGHDCVSAWERRGPQVAFWLYGITDRSWAATVLTDDQPTSTVHQGGPRLLWNDLHAAHQWWTDSARPDPTRFGLTVTPTTETTWLDTSHHPVPAARPLPRPAAPA